MTSPIAHLDACCRSRRGNPGVGVTLEVYENGVARNRLTALPLCSHDFEENEPRWKHVLDEHGPEDAGQSPMDERPESGLPPGQRGTTSSWSGWPPSVARTQRHLGGESMSADQECPGRLPHRLRVPPARSRLHALTCR